MRILKDIIKELEVLAPPGLAESWDNVGLLLGSREQKVSKVLCALDLNLEVAKEAIEEGVDLIVTHHPFLFKAIKSLDLDTPTGKIFEILIRNNISLYAMHTNYDIVDGGLNDYLCAGLGIKKTNVLEVTTKDINGNDVGIGRVGELDREMEFEEFIQYVKNYFNIPYVRITKMDQKQKIKKVAICSGSGSMYIPAAAKSADIYITGDIKFHEAQMAYSMGIPVVDVGHYASESIALEPIKLVLQNKCPQCQVVMSSVDGEMLFTK